MQLTIHTLESAPEASRSTLAAIQSQIGVVPNLAAAMAESPTLLAAFDGVRRAVAAGELDPVHREVAGLAVGVVIDNHYGVAFHSTMLGQLGVDEAEIDALRSNEAPKDETLAAVYHLAQAIVLRRGRVDDAIVDQARDVGLSTAQILEVVAECTLAGLVGTVDNLAGQVELDGFLAARRWS